MCHLLFVTFLSVIEPNMLYVQIVALKGWLELYNASEPKKPSVYFDEALAYVNKFICIC